MCLPKDYYSFFEDLRLKCPISSNDFAHLYCVSDHFFLFHMVHEQYTWDKKQKTSIWEFKQNISNEFKPNAIFAKFEICIAMHWNFEKPKKFAHKMQQKKT